MKFLKSFFAIAIVFALSYCTNNSSNTTETKEEKKDTSSTAQLPNGGITLPAGFSASIFADDLGKARHIVVNSNGDVYTKIEGLKDGHGIFRLRDTNNDGKAEDISGFGNYKGTGIALKNGYLYATTSEKIYRYKLNANNEVDTASEELIVTDLVNKEQHSAKWNYDVGGHGWGNNELQFYTKQRSENARVDKGYLTIEARKETWEGKNYTSARLITKGKGDWQYGKFEKIFLIYRYFDTVFIPFDSINMKFF